MKKPGKSQPPHYIHSLNYTFQERVVGTFVLLAMIALLGLLIATGKTKYLFEDHVTIYGYLPTARGVAPDNTIRISGIDGGYVAGIDISEKNEIIVTMRIFERFHKLLRADSVASLSSVSFLGSNAGIIEITAGSPDQPLLADQASIRIRQSYSMEDLANQVTSALTKVHETVRDLAVFVEKIHPERVADSMADIGQVTTNLRKITDQLAGGGGILGAALYDEEMKKDIKQSVSSLGNTITAVEARLGQLEPILSDTGELSENISATLKGFPELIYELKSTVIQVNAMLSTMDTEIQQLPDLVARMRLLLDESDRTLRAAQRLWPLSSAIQQSGKPTLLITPQPAHE